MVVVVAALLLRGQRRGLRTLSGLALALGVADVVIGLLLYRGSAPARPGRGVAGAAAGRRRRRPGPG